ncbi:hypothetical protein MBLNU459_g5313t1 [Dothideomycetes sp. NU459]
MIRRTTSLQPSDRPSSKDRQNTVLIESSTGELRFFGPSSSVSILSPDGLNWIESHTADSSLRDSLQTPLKERGQWTGWAHPVIDAALTQHLSRPLPPWSDAVALVTRYMDTFNKVLPIFHPPSFTTLLRQQYSPTGVQNAAWWASFNAVLAITQRRIFEDAACSPQESEIPWTMVRNSLDVLLDVLMRNTSLMSVQALVTLAWFFVGSPNPQPSFFLASAAVRMCHAIGLHQQRSSSQISDAETRQKECVFWAATILDQSVSFRTGRPASQTLQDLDISLPSGESLGTIRPTKGKASIHIFHHLASLATVQASIYQDLYSDPASVKSRDQIMETVQALDQAIADWKESIPIEYQPDQQRDAWNGPMNLHIAAMHFEYYNCIITVHRIEGHGGFRGLANKAERGQPVASPSSVEKCLQAARSTLDLFGQVSHLESRSFQWAIGHYPMSALVVLFINILQHPLHDGASSDLDAMGVAIFKSSLLVNNDESNYLRSTSKVMGELYRIARFAITKANKATTRPPSPTPEMPHTDTGEGVEALAAPPLPFQQMGMIGDASNVNTGPELGSINHLINSDNQADFTASAL